jgi:hypothetical protein
LPLPLPQLVPVSRNPQVAHGSPFNTQMAFLPPPAQTYMRAHHQPASTSENQPDLPVAPPDRMLLPQLMMAIGYQPIAPNPFSNAQTLRDDASFLPDLQVPAAGSQQPAGPSSQPAAYPLPLPNNSGTTTQTMRWIAPNMPGELVPALPYPTPKNPQQFYANSLHRIEQLNENLKVDARIRGMTLVKLQNPDSAYGYLMAHPDKYFSAREIAHAMGMGPNAHHKLSQTMCRTFDATLRPFGFDAVRTVLNFNKWTFGLMQKPNGNAAGERGKVYSAPVGHERNFTLPPPE